jgi:hypothetical protein
MDNYISLPNFVGMANPSGYYAVTGQHEQAKPFQVLDGLDARNADR